MNCFSHEKICHAIITVVYFLTLFQVEAIFHYQDFNQTLGLVINGDAMTTICLNNTSSETSFIQSGEKRGMHVTKIVSTHENTIANNDNDNEAIDSQYEASKNISETIAQFGHRDHEVLKNNTVNDELCRTRLRLTPAKADQVGSVWYEKRTPVVCDSRFLVIFSIINTLLSNFFCVIT